MVYSAPLSEVYLSTEQQAQFFDFRIDTSLEQGEEINLNIDKRYPALYKANQKAVKRIQELELSEDWKDISAYVKAQDKDALSWDPSREYDSPIIHHKGDLLIEQTVVIDYPLLVEGNLTIKGNLILKHPLPVFVLGDLNAKHLLHLSGILRVKNKINLSGYAFLERGNETIENKISAKEIYGLYTTEYSELLIKIMKITPDKNKIKPALFPTDPRLVRPSIISWRNDLDNDMLSLYLEKDKEPFITSPKNFKAPKKQAWQYYYDQWKHISNSINKPEIAGAKEVKYKDIKFKEDQSNIPQNEGLLLADMRTGKGFCVYSAYELPPYIEDEEAFKKGVGKPELSLYKSQNDASSSTCSLINRYQNIEYLMKENNNLDYLPEAHLNFYSAVNKVDEALFNKLYQKDKPFLDKDPYIASYWLTHFGIILDDRLEEVLAEAKKQDHPLVKSAVSFYTQKPFDQIYQYASPSSDDDNEAMFTGKYKSIKTGNDIFKKNHSDLIHVFYKNQQLKKKSSFNALLYALKNDHSQRDIDKAKLLADISDDLKAWDTLPFSDSHKRHPQAWQYLALRNPANKATDKQKSAWLTEYLKRDSLKSKASIPVINSLQFKDKALTEKIIAQTTQQEKDDNVLKKLGLDDEYKEKRIKQGVIELMTGKQDVLIQTLLDKSKDKNKNEMLENIISVILGYIGDHEEESLNYDLKTMMHFVDFATEHQLADYDIESTLTLLSKKDKPAVQAWAKEKLKKPRLLWANTQYNYDGIGGIIKYVDLLRKWKKQPLEQ